MTTQPDRQDGDGLLPAEHERVLGFVSDDSVAIDNEPMVVWIDSEGEWWGGLPQSFIRLSDHNWKVDRWEPLPARDAAEGAGGPVIAWAAWSPNDGLNVKAWWTSEPPAITKKMHAEGGWQIRKVEVRLADDAEGADCTLSCAMAKHDGVICPDDSCDIEQGVRSLPTPQKPAPDAVRAATIEECAQLIESGAGMADLIDQEELDQQAKYIRALAAPVPPAVCNACYGDTDPKYTECRACGGDAPVPLTFWYKNHRSEESLRTAFPISIRFGTTEWHTEAQWLLKAFDRDKQAEREFAMRDMLASPTVREDRPTREEFYKFLDKHTSLSEATNRFLCAKTAEYGWFTPVQPGAGEREALIEECAKIADGWRHHYSGIAIGTDIAARIRALSRQAPHSSSEGGQ